GAVAGGAGAGGGPPPGRGLAPAARPRAPRGPRHSEPLARFGAIEVWRRRSGEGPGPRRIRPRRVRESSDQRRSIVVEEQVGRVAIDRDAPRLAELSLGPAAAAQPDRAQ